MNNQVLNHNLAPNPGALLPSDELKTESKIKKKITITRVFAFLSVLFNSLVLLRAQNPPVSRPDPLMQLMTTQPSIEVSSNVVVTAVFDPPVVRPGEKAIYRVTFDAISDSIRWPDDVLTPPELSLRQSSRGQILQPVFNKLKPMTTINHHVRASKTGRFAIPEFKVKVYGKPVTVPRAELEVVSNNSPTPMPMQLQLEITETNAYCGQPVGVRVLMRGMAGNIVQALTQMQLNGDGILLDQSATRQSISQMPYQGRTVATYVFESSLRPLVAGRLSVSAQAFTAGNQFSGAIVIQGNATIPGGLPQQILLDSDPVQLNVEPLPRAGLLPGFVGAIGNFTTDPPLLSTNIIGVGEPLKLLVTIRSAGNVGRLVPPPPPVLTNWQIFPAVASGTPAPQPNQPPPTGNAISFVYTMIPLTNGITTTPVIPYSYFDPKRATYVDLTIPTAQIKVTEGDASSEAQGIAQTAAATSGEEKKLALSAVATSPGQTAAMLTPVQLRVWFMPLQLLPLFGFAGLWAWDRRRRHLEQHPEIVRRRQALKALHRERRAMRRAGDARNAKEFAGAAVNAMRVACAPHFPAEPRAMVCRDVLEVLDGSKRAGEIASRFFAVIDAGNFSGVAADAEGLLALRPELERVLEELEAKL